MTTAHLTIRRANAPVRLTVRGTVEPYVPARTCGPPEQCSEAEGGTADVTDITCDGAPWTGTLTPRELFEAEAALVLADAEDAREGDVDDYRRPSADAELRRMP